MNGYKLLLMLLLAGIVFSCVREPEAPLSDGQIPQETYAPDDEGVLKGWVRIKLRDDAQALRVGTFTRGAMESGDPELDRIAASLGATEVRRVFHEGGRFAERRRKFGLHLWYDVKFDDTLPVSRAQAELGSLSAVAHVQPVYTIRMFDAGNTLPEEAVYVPAQRRAERAGAGPFDDPGLPKQWHYNNDGSGTKWVEGSDINLFEAWEVTAGDPSVIVAVTDHGVEYDHPDLAGNMWVNEAELNGTPGVDDDNNGYVDDIYGWNVILDSGTINPGTHGTHVAGTVAAVNNNGIGVCGVAGGTGNGDGARIMSLAIFDSTSANAGSYPDAYAYAADNGAVISQNSWGYTSGVAMPQDVSDALDYFIANAGVDENGNQTGPMKGGLLVFAAGNEGTPSARRPAADPRTLCVTAMCSDYTRPNYANYSDDVDIFAPGGADGNDRNYSDADRVYSTDLDGGYSYKWGTSMACPHVSGIAALVIAHYGVGHPGFTVEECREILLRSYRSVSEYVEPKYDGKLGVGLADAGMIFLEDAGTAPGTVSAPAARAMGRELELAWTVPADGNGLPVAEFRLTYTGRGIGKTEGKAPDTSGEVVLRNYTAVAETATYIWTGQYNTEYRFEVSGIDRFGHE